MPRSPDSLKVCLIPTVPQPFTGYCCDVIEVEHPDGRIEKHPGLALTPTPPDGSRPTHYPDVRNGLGGYGFHVEASDLTTGRLPDGAIAANPDLPRLEIELRRAHARIDLQMIEAETVEGQRLYFAREFLEDMLALLNVANTPKGDA